MPAIVSGKIGPIVRSGAADGQRAEMADETAFVDSADIFVEKDVTKETAVKQKRVWVRLTRLCNQRCTFCLDSWNQNGTYVAATELQAFIRRGREQGGERLILSGGEATVHPEFLRLCRYGKDLGYEWVQTVTNGQMFAYPDFARRAKVAGLDEATFSMHGHDAKLHDRLVGLPGAFDRANQGIRNLQALGGVVVNVDIVINRMNVAYIRDIIDFYMAMGIREFDLLYIVPFGRGFEEFREQLFFDLDDAFPHLQRAFEVSAQPGVYLWTNRFPVSYLEGYEHLIQEPHKLHSEVNGGRHNFDGYLKTGTPPDCYGERCGHCFLNGLCKTTMFRYRTLFLEGGFHRIRIDADHLEAWDRSEHRLASQKPQVVHVVATTAATAREIASKLPYQDCVSWVAELPAAEFAALDTKPGRFTGIRLQEEAAIDILLTRPYSGLDRIELVINQRITERLLLPETLSAIKPALQQKMVLILPNHPYLSESRANDPGVGQLRALADAGYRLANVPTCIGGDLVVAGDHDEITPQMVGSDSFLDTDSYVDRYIEGEYYAKSLRCKDCVYTSRCRGLHINYLRNVGLASLKPLLSTDSQ